ncbi:uncharacterized protein LOC144636768 [Oculina patagonica]
MMVSEEEKRWLVVGIAMNNVAAPVLRDFIKQGMDTSYANLDIYCRSLTPHCTLKTLTYHHVNTDPGFKHLKFQNVNNNVHSHGKHKKLYNYNINSSVDLAKLFLPDYLAEFSAFDESLDMSAILRLLGFNNPAPIFHSPDPLISIQNSADDVRENVRNKWGHCNVTDWTEVLFNDCFSKLETLVRSLGLTGGREKANLDQLSDWKTKGCQLCMGHAVDQNLLSLVQQDVKELFKNYKKTEAEQTAIQESLSQQRTQQMEIESSTRVQLEEHGEQLAAVLEWKDKRMKENGEILEKLVSIKETLSEELLTRAEMVDKVGQLARGFTKTDDKVKQLERGFAKTGVKVEQLEQGFAKTDDKVDQLEQGFAKTDDKVDQLERGFAKTGDKVEQLEQGFAKIEQDVSETGDKVKQLEQEVRSRRMKEIKPEASPVETFDVKSCRNKLAEHYKRTATVPTSVWSKTSPVDIHQIYTRLTWVKEEQTPAGSSQSELIHYTDVFIRNNNGVVPKRILVQGQTGIGKSTFVKKLAVDWAELHNERTGDKQKDAFRRFEDHGNKSEDNKESSQDHEDTSADKRGDMSENQKNALKKFELVLVIKLKEVSKCRSLRDVIKHSNVFPEEETALMEGLLSYITKNQEKVLLVFDGYDEYRCGRESEIYEIFRGNQLRNCCVLITTRISKADELREFKDVHAEITGFSKKDREAFMCRMLGDKAEASKLKRHLSREKLADLTRVPLLLLFFCTLWKQGKLKSFPETKAKLYLKIVEYVLHHSQGKNDPSRFGKVQEFEEILSEIGKVALECLLKDDHVFEYDQLSATIFCDSSLIIGLLQVTEYAENLRPAGMVSFIHKSIQEFLAAWYVTYRCVPQGSLGEIEQHVRTLEDCKALKNVFQFICGLSKGGALRVFQHLTSVRISDSELDLSKAVPSEENDADVLCDGTYRQRSFSNLVFELFREVDSKAELLSNCFDCLSGVILVPADNRSLSKLPPKMKDFTNLVHSVAFVFPEAVVWVLKSLEFLDCLHVPLKISESSKLYNVGDFLKQFMDIQHSGCGFRCVLCFRNGKFQFYMTNLELHCDDHARLFTETSATSVPSLSASLCSEEPCLKYLRHVQCYHRLSSQTMKALGVLMRDCNHLKSIEIKKSDDSVCDLLEQVPNPSKCSLKIGSSNMRRNSWLLRFNNIITLDLDLSNCCSAAVDTLVSSITHKTLERLVLRGIILTPAAAVALGRSLPEMSSLEILKLTGKNGILTTEEMEALFGGLNKTLPLYKLSLSRFIVTSCLASLTQSFRFFPNLRNLNIGRLNMDERNTCVLLESLRFIPNLEKLSICKPPGNAPHGCSCAAEAVDDTVISFTHINRKEVLLKGISLTPAVAAAIGRSLPEMSSLETLVLTGEYGNIVQAEEIEAMFGGFNKTLPLRKLTFSGFSVRGCLAPLIKSLRFFPNLTELSLEEFNADERDLCGVLDNLRFIPNLERLIVQCSPLGHASCCTAEVNTVSSFTHVNLKELKLSGISLTPAVAATLGRLLPEISCLQKLVLTGFDGSIVQAKKIEALFGSFNKTLSLYKLTFSGFKVRGCLASLTKSLRFIPNLRELNLENLNLDEHDQCILLESFGFIAKNVMELSIACKPVGHSDCRTAEVNTVGTRSNKRRSLKKLELNGITLTPAVVTALAQSLPVMSLKTLELTGEDGSMLQAKEMEALFNKTLPKLYRLTFRGFSVKGCLAPLTKTFRLFPSLRMLHLEELNLDEQDMRGLLKSLTFIPNQLKVHLFGNPFNGAVRFTANRDQRLGTTVCFSRADCSEEDLSYFQGTSR